MDIKKRDFLLAAGAATLATAALAQGASKANHQPSTVDPHYKPRRINKAIELWEDGQPIYYNSAGMGPGVDPYKQGLKMAGTWMDAINVEMEHNALDFMQLREFMRGLKDGGPTKSGHATPAVFVETCIIALDEAYMRANTWVIEQLLDCGIHGIHMCHARDTRAVQVATQMACRYPFDRPGIAKLPMQGLRGSSPGYAAQMWGVPMNKYLHLADLWPLNPKGELIFGIKIEDTYADKTVAQTMKLPGISMAEWGPGDHSYWLYGLEAYPEDGLPIKNLQDRPEMVAVRKQVIDLCKQHKVMFLNAGNNNPASSDYTIKQIRDGAMVIEGDEASAVAGREFTRRKMPV